MAPSQAVNYPMNKEQRDKDINIKLQLYGIYSAFSHGKVPSNKQIDVALNSFLASEPLSSPSNKLSSEGRVLVQDFRDVVYNAKQLLLSKNQGNLLQEFIWEAENLAKPETTQLPETPVTKEEAKQHREQAVGGLKTLGTLLVTNGQFRKLLSDATILLRDMAGDTAQRVAGRVKPSEEELAQIDEPAAPDTWHEAPDFSKDKLKTQMKLKKEKAKDTKETGRQDVSDATGAAKDTARSSAQMNGPDSSAAADGAANGVQTLKQRGNEKVPEETKGKTRELADKTRDFLAEKMPQERREQTIWRLKRMLVEIQNHDDYQQAIEALLSLAETYTGHLKDLSKKGTEAGKGAREEMGLQSAEEKLKTLIERFANSTSTDDFFDSLNDVYRDADRDPRLKKWFESLNSFIRKCLREKGYVLEDSTKQEWNDLYDEGRFLLRERYRDDTNNVVDEIKFLADQFDQDPLNRAFRNSMEKLFQDLGKDTSGNVVFKKHLLKDITDIILPATFEHIRYVPVPRIEVSDPMIDAVVENLVIESDNLMPNVVEFGSDNYFRWGRKNIKSKRDNKMMISATGIQTDWRDVSYYIKRKSGFPRIRDQGVMDVLMGGEGFSFRVSGSNVAGDGERHFLKADKISVSVKNLDIKLKKSKHKALFTIFKPMLFKVVQPAVEKLLEQQICEMFNRGDAFAHEVYANAHRAQESAIQEEQEEKRSIYSYYVDAIRNKLTETKQEKQRKAEELAKRDTKFKFAVTHHDSLFPDIKLPGGISKKATEYKELAAQGERWESPVFSIGSAPESTHIPQLAPIKRKPHATRLTSGKATRPEELAGREHGLREREQTQQAAATDQAAATETSRTAMRTGSPSHQHPYSSMMGEGPRTIPGTQQSVF